VKATSYSRALSEARAELERLFQKREELEREIARARLTVIALGRMCDEGKHRDFLKSVHEHTKGLTGAIRWVLMAAKQPLYAPDIRRELESVGYDVGSSPNVLVSIHTILRRLVADGEVKQVGRRITTGKGKGLWTEAMAYWRGQHGLPKGWSVYPDKKLTEYWDKTLATSARSRDAERELEERAREEALKRGK